MTTDIARKDDVNYNLEITPAMLVQWECHAIAVDAWQATMDVCKDNNLCPTLHGQAIFHYLDTYLNNFHAHMDMDETFNKYRDKI